MNVRALMKLSPVIPVITVTDLAHHTHVFACHIGLGSSDLGFNVLQ